MDAESEETKALMRKSILENVALGGSGWKDFTDEELKALGLEHLIKQR
jgi:ATP-dependent phosphoenolpyruvate carboxykinase